MAAAGAGDRAPGAPAAAPASTTSQSPPPLPPASRDGPPARGASAPGPKVASAVVEESGVVVSAEEREASTSSIAALLDQHREDITALRGAVADAAPRAGAAVGAPHEGAAGGSAIDAAAGAGGGGSAPAAAAAAAAAADGGGQQAGGSDGAGLGAHHLCYDDIFYLRYILSFGSAKAAEGAVRRTFAWREENRALLQQAALGLEAFRESYLGRLFEEYMAAGEVVGGARDGGFIMLVRGGPSRMDDIHGAVTRDEFWRIQICHREIAYRMCDRIAREHGRLVKQIIFFDMAGVAFSTMMDRKTSAVHSEVSHLSAVIYPQLQAKMCLVNAPTWMTVVLAAFRKILPARVLSKVELFSSTDALWASPWAAATLDRSRFPASMGGTLPDGEVPTYHTGENIRPLDADEIVHVPARSVQTIENAAKVKAAGARVTYMFSVASHDVLVSARLVHSASPDGGAVPPATALVSGLRVVADDGPRKGEWRCDAPGVVEITVDNTGSFLRSKTLKYCVTVEPS